MAEMSQLFVMTVLALDNAAICRVSVFSGTAFLSRSNLGLTIDETIGNTAAVPVNLGGS
jgi:hypothetical protein